MQRVLGKRAHPEELNDPETKGTKPKVAKPEVAKPKVAEVSTEGTKPKVAKPKVAEVSPVPTAVLKQAAAYGKAKTKQQHVAAAQFPDQTAAAVAVLEEMCPEDKAAALAAMPYQERAAALAVMQCDKQLNDPETTVTSLSVPLLNEAGLAVGTPHANSSGLTNQSNTKLLPEKSFEKLAKPKQASAVTEVVKSADVAVKKQKLAVTKPGPSGMRSLHTFFNRVAPK